jgi:hypothetical protein
MSVRGIKTKPISDTTMARVAWLRLTLAMEYPRPLRIYHVAQLLGTTQSTVEQKLLTLMEDIWQEDGKIGLTDDAAELYEARLERKYP